VWACFCQTMPRSGAGPLTFGNAILHPILTDSFFANEAVKQKPADRRDVIARIRQASVP
jgi:hypothetical protein